MLPQEMFTKEASEQFLQFKEHILMQWRQILQQSVIPSDENSTSMSSSTPHSTPTTSLSSSSSSSCGIATTLCQALLHNPQLLDRFVKEQTSVVPVRPLLFAALHLRSGFPLELLKDLTLREVLAKTYIPSLICTIPNRLLVKCAKSLRELSHLILKQITAETKLILKHDTDALATVRRIPTLCLTADKLISTFSVEINEWKNELEQRVKKMENALNEKAQECSRHLNTHSSSHRTHESFSSSSSRALDSLHHPYQSNIQSSDLMELEFERLSLVDIEKSHCGPLIDSATQLWVQLIEVLHFILFISLFFHFTNRSIY
jgi:hypothetical protein